MKRKFWLRSLELLIRVLCFYCFINLITSYEHLFIGLSLHWFDFLSSLFYFSLLIVIILMIKKMTNSVTLEKLDHFLNYPKWIFLVQTTVLLIVKWQLVFILNGDGASVLLPNLGFIVITLLVFFLSAVLEERNELKQEQDLTI